MLKQCVCAAQRSPIEQRGCGNERTSHQKRLPSPPRWPTSWSPRHRDGFHNHDRGAHSVLPRSACKRIGAHASRTDTRGGRFSDALALQIDDLKEALMNSNCRMKRTITGAVAAIMLVSGTAAAAGTHWSFGLSLPGSLEPAAPVYYEPPPAYVLVPARVYVAPPPVLRPAPPVFYLPAPSYRPSIGSLRIEHHSYHEDADEDDDD